jgi:hypothetical protein
LIYRDLYTAISGQEPAGQGVSWEPNALARVVDLAEGYPYFLQEYGQEVWK